MADTPALEAGEGNLVEVQVLSPAFSFFDIFLIFANIPLIERCSHGIILSASLAQLVEQLPLKEMVGGSNPSRGNERSELTNEGFEGRNKIFASKIL